ncbi:MAG: hypothetical protein ACFFAE_19270, partial [Candidatus Hodarchaeota archaeon]
LQFQGVTQGTIDNYLYLLAKIPHDVDDYFANQNLKGRKMKIYAYRSYLKFLCKKKRLISRGDMLEALDTFKTFRNEEMVRVTENGVFQRNCGRNIFVMHPIKLLR